MGGLVAGTLVGGRFVEGLDVGPETRDAVGMAVAPAGAGVPTMLLTGEEVGDDMLPATGDDTGEETAGNEVGDPGLLGVAPVAADGAEVEEDATGEGEVGALDLCKLGAADDKLRFGDEEVIMEVIVGDMEGGVTVG